jgi:hypothetical protein
VTYFTAAEARRSVCLWHKADIPTLLNHVRFGGKADGRATTAKPERRPVHPLRHQKHLRGTSPVTEFWQGAREVKVSGLKRHSLAFGSLAPDAGVSGDGERPGLLQTGVVGDQQPIATLIPN